MTYPSTEIDKISVELHSHAEVYANKAAALASDPYFKEAIMKVSVSGFVWALYHAFDDAFSREALAHVLKTQLAAVERTFGGTNPSHH